MRRAPSQTASERPREVSSPSIRVYRYEAVSKNNAEHRFSQQLCSCNFRVHVFRSAGALGAGAIRTFLWCTTAATAGTDPAYKECSALEDTFAQGISRQSKDCRTGQRLVC